MVRDNGNGYVQGAWVLRKTQIHVAMQQRREKNPLWIRTLAFWLDYFLSKQASLNPFAAPEGVAKWFGLSLDVHANALSATSAETLTKKKADRNGAVTLARDAEIVPLIF